MIHPFGWQEKQCKRCIPVFIYLGSVVSKTGGTEEDIQAVISKARHAFVALKPIWNSRTIHLQMNLKLFESNVKTALLYGSETWRRT